MPKRARQPQLTRVPRSAPAEPFTQLEKAIGLRSPSPEFRDRLKVIVGTYCPPNVLDQPVSQLDRLIELRDPVRPAQANKWLKTIERRANELLETLTIERDDPNEEWVRSQTIEKLIHFQRLGTLTRGLKELAAAAVQLQKPDPSGRLGNEWLRAIIRELVALYREATGRVPRRNIKGGKPQGKLFAFVQLFLRSFAKPVPSDSAIDEAIRHITSPRKR